MQDLTRRTILGAAAAAAGSGWAGFAPDARASEKGPGPLVGTWTYRSFLNDPDPAKAFNDLQFAVADIAIQESDFGVLSGRLSFGSDYLKLTGTITYGNPFSVRFQGVGATPGTIEDGHPWIYDYLGYVAPAWPNGTADNPPAIVGTIVRAVAHSQGQAKAGFVASFIALRRASPKA